MYLLLGPDFADAVFFFCGISAQILEGRLLNYAESIYTDHSSPHSTIGWSCSLYRKQKWLVHLLSFLVQIVRSSQVMEKTWQKFRSILPCITGSGCCWWCNVCGGFSCHTLGPLIKCHSNATAYPSIVVDHVHLFMTTCTHCVISDGYLQ